MDYFMHIVVKRREEPSTADAAAFACAAAYQVACKWSDKQEYAAWLVDNMGKVCLKARPSEWSALLEREDCVVVNDVLVSMPMKRSERPAIFNKMNIAQWDTGVSVDVDDSADLLLNPHLLALVSPGKWAAQCAHVATLAHQQSLVIPTVVRIAFASQIQWRTVLADVRSIVVTDAGHTEIPPNTQTVCMPVKS